MDENKMLSEGQPMPPAPERPPQSTAERVFLSEQGLRSGWGFLLYLLIGAGLMIGAHGLSSLWRSAHIGKMAGNLIGEVMVVLVVLLPAVAMAKIEGRPFGAYGLPARETFSNRFWQGMLWGIAAITLLLVVLRLANVFYFGSSSLQGVSILKYAAYWGLFFLGVGFFEEFLFRGYTFFTLSRAITFWPAAVLLSLVFGGVHLGNQGESWAGAVAAGLIGLFFCFTLRRTGSLWYAVGFHASWDWGESYLYGVPDSGTMVPGHLLNPSFHGPAWLTGGSVGPEGSVLVFVVIGILFAVFHWRYPAMAGAAGERRFTTEGTQEHGVRSA